MLNRRHTSRVILGILTCAALGGWARAGQISTTHYLASDTVAFSFEDISPTGTATLEGQDDAVAGAPLGFTFNFYGRSYTRVNWSSNGLISFGAPYSHYTNLDLNTAEWGSEDSAGIAVFWDDLVLDAGIGRVYHELRGGSGSRRFIIQWQSARPYSQTTGSITFQAVLFEETNQILLQYADVSAPPTSGQGGSATVGIRDRAGHLNGRRLQWSYQQPVLQAGTAILFERVYGPTRLFVDAFRFDGAQNGTSWENAYRSLSQALTAAGQSAGTVAEIWVARGTYYPTTSGDRGVSFNPVNGVCLYGGFLPGATSLAHRFNGSTYLSGNIGGSSRNDNSYHVIRSTGNDGTAVLDNVIIEDGYADQGQLGLENTRGAGVFVDAGSAVTFVNCTFRRNEAIYAGSGIMNYGAVALENCFMSNNPGNVGGAIYNNGVATIRSCTFRQNTASLGGGLYNEGSRLLVRDTLFDRNIVTSRGGAVRNIALLGSTADFVNCWFTGNQAVNGGAVANLHENYPTFANCVFSGNKASAAGSGGGALYNQDVTVSVVNCTFANNETSGTGGGGIHNASEVGGEMARCNVNNSILWGNRNSSGIVPAAQVQNDNGAGEATINHSIVQGGWSGSGGQGILNLDPLFVQPLGPDGVAGTSDDDLRTVIQSPAVDAGSNAALPLDVADLDDDAAIDEVLPLDAGRAARRYDIAVKPDAGAGVSPIVDLGAYEAFDCNGNGIPDNDEPDSDGDLLIDGCDNCPLVYNLEQTQSDAVAGGDACDHILFEDFENYADQAGFEQVWTDTLNSSYLLTPGIGNFGQALRMPSPAANSLGRYHRNLGGRYTGTDLKPLVLAYDLYLNPSGAAANWNNARHFCELRGYAGGSFNNGALQTLVAIGLYNAVEAPGETYNNYEYQGRVLGPGWYSLDQNPAVVRQAGWHRIKAELTLTKVRFYVDNQLAETVERPDALGFDTVVLGSDLTAGGHEVVIDNVAVVGGVPVTDCNNNGTQDAQELFSTSGGDWNLDQVLDDCQQAALGRVIDRVSLETDETEINDFSAETAISGDGRYVVFQSGSQSRRLRIRDRVAGSTTSVWSGVAPFLSPAPVISADGRHIAFVDAYESTFPPATSIFWLDRLTNTLQTVADYDTIEPALSADGRYIAYTQAPTFSLSQVYVFDTALRTSHSVSESQTGELANGSSYAPAISKDGRYIAFASAATDLVPGDSNGVSDIFVRDRQLGVTTRVSIGAGGAQLNGHSNAPSISWDGRYVAFESDATNAVAGDTNGMKDIFVHDRQTAATTRVSVGPGGVQADQPCFQPHLSGSGARVIFSSNATTLGGTFAAAPQLYVVEVSSGRLSQVSPPPLPLSPSGGNPGIVTPAFSADGRHVAFATAMKLVPDDYNSFSDVFVRDLDCNRNLAWDAAELAAGTLMDCNQNTLPDVCEIASTSGAPGGPFFCPAECALDCDQTGQPDECEASTLLQIRVTGVVSVDLVLSGACGTLRVGAPRDLAVLPSGTVTLTAPFSTPNGLFTHWIVDGQPQPFEQMAISLNAAAPHLVAAVYEPLFADVLAVSTVFEHQYAVVGECKYLDEQRILRTEVTNGQYVAFLNDAQEAQEAGDTSKRSSNMVFETSGRVVLADGSVMFEPQSVAPASRILYDVAAPAGHRYRVQQGYRDHPVVHVSWLGGAKFCNWLGSAPLYREGPYFSQWSRQLAGGPEDRTVYMYRLPSLAEWQAVAGYSSAAAPDVPRVGPSGETIPAHYWTYGVGRDVITGAHLNFLFSGDPFESGTTPVGFFDGTLKNPGGNGPLGNGIEFQTRRSYNIYNCADMSGNVREWVDAYPEPGGMPQPYAMGGSWAQPADLASIFAPSAPLPSAFTASDTGLRLMAEVSYAKVCDNSLPADCAGYGDLPDQAQTCCDFAYLDRHLFETPVGEPFGQTGCADDYHPDGYIDHFDIISLDPLVDECVEGQCPCIDPNDCPYLFRGALPAERLAATPADGPQLLILGRETGYVDLVYRFEAPWVQPTRLLTPLMDPPTAYVKAKRAIGDTADRVYLTDYAARAVHQIVNASGGTPQVRVLSGASFDFRPTDLAVIQTGPQSAILYVLVEQNLTGANPLSAYLAAYTFDPAAANPVLTSIPLAGTSDLGRLPDTFLGGSENWLRWARALSVDRAGYLYVAGISQSTQPRLMVFSPITYNPSTGQPTGGDLVQTLLLTTATGRFQFYAAGLHVSPCGDELVIGTTDDNRLYRFTISRDGNGVPMVSPGPAEQVTLSGMFHLTDVSVDWLSRTAWVVGDHSPAKAARVALGNPGSAEYFQIEGVRIAGACALLNPPMVCGFPADLDDDLDVDAGDVLRMQQCRTGPAVPYIIPPAGCPLMLDGSGFLRADLDRDRDVDLDDFALLQRCNAGESRFPPPGCAQ